MSETVPPPAAEKNLAARLALLEAVTVALGDDLELDGLLDRVLTSVLDVTGVSGGGIFLFDERTDHLRLVAHRGIGERMARNFAANPGERLRRMAIDSRATLIVRKITDLNTYRPLIAEDGVQAYAAIPLKARGRPVGVLAVISHTQTDFSAADVDLIVSIGKQIGLAIDRARLYDEAQRSLRRVQAFQEIAAAITESLDVQTTVERVLDAAMAVFEAERAALYLVVPGTRQTYCPAARNLSTGYIDAVLAHYNEHDWPKVFDTRRSVYVEDAQAIHLTPELQRQIEREDFRTMLFLPMPDGASRLGTIVLYHDAVRRYSEAETTLAITFADQANIAIQHARLFDAERRAREQASTILEATRAVTATLQFEDVLREAAGRIAAALGQRV